MSRVKDQLIDIHNYLVDLGQVDDMDMTIHNIGVLSTKRYGELLEEMRNWKYREETSYWDV